MKKIVIAGAGPSGLVIARRYAEQGNKVLVMEERDHIAGNLFDYKNKDGIIIHKYGPHIFQTSDDDVINYVKQFGEWKEFRHKVNVRIGDLEVPLPINFKSIDTLWPDRAEEIKETLTKEFEGHEVTYIVDMINHSNPIVKEIGDFVYSNVFENYTTKMWGITPEEIDPSVLKRVPIRLSYDDGYFTDKFQAVPKEGYTKIFEEIANHPNIEIKLNTNALEAVVLRDNKFYLKDTEEEIIFVWTGAIDRLFDYKYGELPYRSLRFEFEDLNVDSFQSRYVVNYPADPQMTRITEYKKLSQQEDDKTLEGKTAIGREYPGQYGEDGFDEPYYPIFKKDQSDILPKYFKEADSIENLIYIGRLAENKYKQMWMAIKDALEKELI